MPTLHVVTHQRWVADDFATAPPKGWRVRHSYGLDLPAIEPGDALWAPMEWAARAYRSGLDHPLMVPPANLLDGIPGHRHRGCFTMLLSALTAFAPFSYPVFAKLAAMKHPDVPATVYPEGVADFVDLLQRLGAPPDTLVQWQSVMEPLWCAEFRLFVAEGRFVGGSPYLLRDGGTETLWHPGMSDDRLSAAIEYARDNFAGAGAPGCVMDVGVDVNGRWSVIEVNPAWSAATYGAPIEAAWAAVIAANRPYDAPCRWRPDPWLVKIAQRQSVLPGPASRRQPNAPKMFHQGPVTGTLAGIRSGYQAQASTRRERTPGHEHNHHRL